MIKLQMILFYGTWIIFSLIILIGYANYVYFEELSLNLYIVTLLVKSNPFTTIFIIISLMLIIIYQYKLYKEKLENRKNCQITYVDLEKIAHLWLEYEEIEDNIEHKMMEKMEVSFDESKKDIQEVINTLIGTRNIQDMSFYKKYIFNYIDFFSKYELEIVAVLYELLETKAKKLPSVATLYKSDTDKSIYKDIVSEKLTSYEILYKVNLFNHTMNVVENIYNILIKEKDSFVFGWSKMLISALAHDIGKIEKIESLKGLSGLEKGKYENNTHENISRLIISNAFPNYEYIDDVCEIIEKHHIQTLDEKNKNYKSIKYLKNADQFARKQEIKEYLNNKKDNSNDDVNISEIDNELLPEIELLENSEIVDDKVQDISSLIEKNDVITENQDIIFSPSDIGNLIELIIKNINEVEVTPKTNRVKLLSISNVDELIMPKEVFIKFAKTAGLNSSTEKDLNALLKKLKTDGLLNYETSNIYLDGFSNAAYKSRRDYLIFDLNSLGIISEDADLKRRNQEHLRNVTINKASKE
jgi:hypothetical protein